MHQKFSEHLENVVALYAELTEQEAKAFPGGAPAKPGIYLFLHEEKPERVGRSKNLRNRLRNHLRPDHNSGAYAFKRARHRFGTKATYKKGAGRKELQGDPLFYALFLEEIERLKTLTIKWIVVENDVDQYLLELYAAMELDLLLDEFGTH